MTQAQREAHLRLLEKMREHTRTHVGMFYNTSGPGIKHSPQKRIALRDKLLLLQSRGYTVKDMARECHTSRRTIIRLLRNQ